jgi:aryl-alcohol dehydrogenase-like predicted oxidoreductase
VTEIGFGGWGIGSFHYGDVSEKDGRACIETYLHYGGNFIDTARLYNNSEKIIGHVLQKHGNRERVFVASKSPTPVFETFLDIHKNELFIA